MGPVSERLQKREIALST